MWKNWNSKIDNFLIYIFSYCILKIKQKCSYLSRYWPQKVAIPAVSSRSVSKMNAKLSEKNTFLYAFNPKNLTGPLTNQIRLFKIQNQEQMFLTLYLLINWCIKGERIKFYLLIDALKLDTQNNATFKSVDQHASIFPKISIHKDEQSYNESQWNDCQSEMLLILYILHLLT